jgi:hypothetical protein
MADLATTTVDSEGVALSTAVAAGAAGDTVEPGALLVVTNGSGAPVNVTLVTPELRDGDLAVAVRVVAVAAGASTAIRVPASATYKNVDGRVDVTYSDETSVTVLALK